MLPGLSQLSPKLLQLWSDLTCQRLKLHPYGSESYKSKWILHKTAEREKCRHNHTIIYSSIYWTPRKWWETLELCEIVELLSSEKVWSTKSFRILHQSLWNLQACQWWIILKSWCIVQYWLIVLQTVLPRATVNTLLYIILAILLLITPNSIWPNIA